MQVSARKFLLPSGHKISRTARLPCVGIPSTPEMRLPQPRAVIRASIEPPPTPADAIEEPIFIPPPSRGLGLAPLASNIGVQLLYCSVGVLGVSALLAPFGGPSVPKLLGIAAPWHAYDGAFDGPSFGLIEMALGGGVAYLGVNDALEDDASKALDYTPAQAEQMRPLYEIAAGEPSLPVAAAAIGAWQLSIALAEELYYRGFVESAGILALSFPLRGTSVLSDNLAATAFVEGLPLIVSAALFGLVHAEFVEGAGAAESGDANAPAPVANADGVVDTKAYWFRATAAYGVLYSLLYVGTGHRLLAPACCHAGLNVGLSLRDWKRMRATDASKLKRVFAAGQGRDTFGLD